jgi:hypothetical protein
VLISVITNTLRLCTNTPPAIASLVPLRGFFPKKTVVSILHQLNFVPIDKKKVVDGKNFS